jgi:hypothetical protein
MGQTQYYGLAKTPNYGLDYESAIKALARVLPQAYAQKQATASTDAANTAALDYYNKMTDIGNKENELTAEQIALNEASMKAAQDAQTQQLGLGLLGTGISAYGLYKNMSLANKIANAAKGAGGDVLNSEPGLLSKTWSGAKGLASDAYNKLFGPSTTETASTIALPETTSAAPGIVDMQSGWEALPNTGTSTGLQSLNLMGEAPIALESTASSTIPGALDMGAGWEALPTLESATALESGEAIASALPEVSSVLENTPYMAANAADAGMATADVAGSTGLASTAGSIVGRAVPVIAMVGALSSLRDKYGGTDKDYREKSAKERFFDDPGMGLGANVMGAIFGDKSEMARIPMQVGEQFSHYAGGPISKAFHGDFEGGWRELVDAPQTTLESFGVDKKTAETVNLILNPAKVVKKIWDSIF